MALIAETVPEIGAVTDVYERFSCAVVRFCCALWMLICWPSNVVAVGPASVSERVSLACVSEFCVLMMLFLSLAIPDIVPCNPDTALSIVVVYVEKSVWKVFVIAGSAWLPFAPTG